MDLKPILNAGIAAQAASLAMDNVAFAKKKKKNFLKQGTKNIVGVSLLRAQSNIVGGL